MSASLLMFIDWGFYAVSAASVVAWIWILNRYWKTATPIIQPQSRREPFWSLAEFFLMFGLSLVCSVAAATTARRYWSPPTDATAVSESALTDLEAAASPPQSVETLTAVAVALAIANIVVLVCMVVQMGLTQRRFLNRSGLWPSLSDIRLGAIASLFILPPVLWLATLLEKLVPYEHNVFNLIQKNPVPSVFWAMALSAIAVAPIFEEFMFRMLLQGGGERVMRRSQKSSGGESLTDAELVSLEHVSAEEVSSWSWWPVVISSLTFSMLHLGQGAAPIALFFFSLALGYIYRQTGRLWPCITVHLILNTVSLTGFILQVIAKK